MAEKNIKVELNFVLFVRTLAAVSLCLLVACTADIKSVEPTLNPKPKEIYDITVTVEGAPGEFLSAEGVHRYAIEDETCLPLTSFSGVPAVTYARYEKVRYKRTTPTTFTARVVLDKFMPKDDYGLGLCKWTSNVLSAKLNNGINQHTISFSPISELQAKRFYLTDFFKLKRDEKFKDLSISGYDISQINGTDKFFTMTIEARRTNL